MILIFRLDNFEEIIFLKPINKKEISSYRTRSLNRNNSHKLPAINAKIVDHQHRAFESFKNVRFTPVKEPQTINEAGSALSMFINFIILEHIICYYLIFFYFLKNLLFLEHLMNC